MRTTAPTLDRTEGRLFTAGVLVLAVARLVHLRKRHRENSEKTEQETAEIRVEAVR